MKKSLKTSFFLIFMTKLPKATRTRLNEELLDLEEWALSTTNPKEVSEEILRVKTLLDRHSVTPDSKYRTRLEEFQRKAEVFFKGSSTDKTEDSAGIFFEYIGTSERYHLIVNPDEKGFYLNQTYTRFGTSLTWLFNINGRIRVLGCEVSGRRNDFLVIGDGNDQDAWDHKKIRYSDIPEELFNYSPGLRKDSDTEIIRKTLRYGHITVSFLYANLFKGRIEDDRSFETGQKGLSEILDDPRTLGLVENTARVFPFIHKSQKGFVHIEYKKNNRFRPFK